jgi:hypothetical protein
MYRLRSLKIDGKYDHCKVSQNKKQKQKTKNKKTPCEGKPTQEMKMMKKIYPKEIFYRILA